MNTNVGKNAKKKPAKKRKNPHAVALGKARFKGLTAEERSELAKHAISVRWAKHRAKKEAAKARRNPELQESKSGA